MPAKNGASTRCSQKRRGGAGQFVREGAPRTVLPPRLSLASLLLAHLDDAGAPLRASIGFDGSLPSSEGSVQRVSYAKFRSMFVRGGARRRFGRAELAELGCTHQRQSQTILIPRSEARIRLFATNAEAAAAGEAMLPAPALALDEQQWF